MDVPETRRARWI